MAKLVLSIELIPKSSWGVSLANLLDKPTWDKIRKQAYNKADHTCEICEATGIEVHAHEVWKFDDKKRTQTLRNIVCICVDCHEVIHYGRSEKVYGVRRLKQLRNHWCEVNGRKENEFYQHFGESMEIWKRRSKHQYKVVVGRTLIG